MSELSFDEKSDPKPVKGFLEIKNLSKTKNESGKSSLRNEADNLSQSEVDSNFLEG